ncbi:MAG: SBBP repeat-containing protein [Polyangiaceae bacterium]|nr:SBBP repeat-containing protein [Polyangiaceae bacterium]
MRIKLGAIAALLALPTFASTQASVDKTAQGIPSKRPTVSAPAAFARVPLYFVENRSVYPEEVKYYIEGADKTLYFTDQGITIRLNGKDRAWVVKLDFVGASPDARPEGLERQQATFSYFKGPEKDWKTALPSFAKVIYRELWPGIDLVYTGAVNQLKYEFLVAPGADPSLIRLRYRGVDRLALTHRGALRVETPDGCFEDAPPVAFQEIDGNRVPVDMRYALAGAGESGAHEFGFHLGDYDRTRPLVLDPAVLVYCGYIGSGPVHQANGVTVDTAGNAYVTGLAYPSDPKSFPAVVGPDVTYNGGPDVFVAKVNASGTSLLYCGFIGGSSNDRANGIAVDAAGSAYVVGETGGPPGGFPVVVGPSLTKGSSTNTDVFIAKVSASGTSLVYCGYLGGTAGSESGYGIAVDHAGSAYICGESAYGGLPVRVGPDLTYNGSWDGFVAKVSASGASLEYCGYIGGAGTDACKNIAVDGSGNAFVTGYTRSTEQTFPVAVGPDLTWNGSEDAFIAKVNAAGTALVYCGYVGGVDEDIAHGIALDAAGNATVIGYSRSTEQTFPVSIGPDLTWNGGSDAFVAKVNAAGTALVYCGYIGGVDEDVAHGIALDPAGNATVVGYTRSTEQTFPVSVGPDLTQNGGPDGFIAKINPRGTGLVYCGYIGGTEGDFAYGITVDVARNAYVAGVAGSTETTFPVKVGPGLTFTNQPPLWTSFVAKVALTLLVPSGRPGIGSTINLDITASDSAGLTYVMGSSLGSGPIPIDQRKIELSVDDLLVVTLRGYLPSVFQGYAGVIAATGTAAAAVQIPNASALVGVKIYTAFVTLKPSAPSGVHAISNTVDFTIEK